MSVPCVGEKSMAKQKDDKERTIETLEHEAGEQEKVYAVRVETTIAFKVKIPPSALQKTAQELLNSPSIGDYLHIQQDTTYKTHQVRLLDLDSLATLATANEK